MLQSFLCCLRSKNVVPPDIVTSITNGDKNIDNICVKITDDESSKTYLTLLDTRCLYDSAVLLNNLERTISRKDTIRFVPPLEKGIVIKVYDGDTISIASKLPYPSSPLYRFLVRLNGIDCPKINGKDKNEKDCAQIAKQEMSDIVLNKIVTLKNVQTEKYGRVVSDVYIGELHLNSHMIEQRLAVRYNIGKKNSPRNWINYYTKGEL